MIRVVIIGGSMVERADLERHLATDPEITVIGGASPDSSAIDLVLRVTPDILILETGSDLPTCFHLVQQVMARRPLPILVLVDQEQRNSEAVARLLAAGALEALAKPAFGSVSRLSSRELTASVRLLARVPVITHMAGRLRPAPFRAGEQQSERVCRAAVAIVASTGGPAALAKLLSSIPAGFAAPIFLVQHMAVGFTGELANWFQARCALQVRLAVSGDMARAGVVLLSPDDSQMTVSKGGRMVLEPTDTSSGVRPSGDRLFESVARMYGPRSIGVVLTGMGNDGVAGATSIKRVGGRVVAQDESTSTIFGMPKEIIDRGIADEVLPIEAIGEKLVFWIGS